MTDHLSQDALLDLAYGELPPEQAAAGEAHVQGCEACTRELTQIRGVRRAMAKLPVEPPPQSGQESLLAYAAQAARRRQSGSAGSRWGRYLAVLGSLTAAIVVGVVARRVQPELDTAVFRPAVPPAQATSVMHVEPAPAGARAQGTETLEKLAQAPPRDAAEEMRADDFKAQKTEAKQKKAPARTERQAELGADKETERDALALHGAASNLATKAFVDKSGELSGLNDGRKGAGPGSAGGLAESANGRARMLATPEAGKNINSFQVASDRVGNKDEDGSLAPAKPAPVAAAPPATVNSSPVAAPAEAFEKADSPRSPRGAETLATGDVVAQPEPAKREVARKESADPIALLEQRLALAHGADREPLLHQLCGAQLDARRYEDAERTCAQLLAEFPRTRFAVQARERVAGARRARAVILDQTQSH